MRILLALNRLRSIIIIYTPARSSKNSAGQFISAGVVTDDKNSAGKCLPAGVVSDGGELSPRRPSLRSSLQRTVVRRHLPFTGPWVGTGLRGDSPPPPKSSAMTGGEILSGQICDNLAGED